MSQNWETTLYYICLICPRKQCVFSHYYSMETCTVGGTRESHVWDTKVNQKDMEEVLARACKVVPSLRVRFNSTKDILLDVY